MADVVVVVLEEVEVEEDVNEVEVDDAVEVVEVSVGVELVVVVLLVSVATVESKQKFSQLSSDYL